MPRGVSGPRGFTILEILVVIAIIGALIGTVAIVVPSMQEKQKKSQREAAFAEQSDYPTSDNRGSWKLVEPEPPYGLYEISVSGGRLYVLKSMYGVSTTYVPTK